MKEFKVPSLRSVAFAGAAWLGGIALLLVVPFSGVTSLGDLLGRELIGGIFLLAAVYLVRLGIDGSAYEESTQAMAKEPIRRIDVTRRAA